MAIKNYKTSTSVIDFEDYSRVATAELMMAQHLTEHRDIFTYPQYDSGGYMMTVDGRIYKDGLFISRKPEPTRTVYLDEMLSEYE